MNREKKQLVVVGVLATLILGVGAFQFTRGEAKAPTSEKPKKASDKGAKEGEKKLTAKYPELFPLAPKDPFTTAAFVTSGNAPTPKPTVPQPSVVPGTRLTDGQKGKITGTLVDPSIDTGAWQPGGNKEVKPAEPPKPVFGYILVGVVDGAHPAAVFDDGKGNQQLVEVGQGVGPSSKVLSISHGVVRVQFNAETLNLNVGGNPNAK